MSIFDSLGNALNEAFAAGGERLAAAYDLGGGMIYTAKALDETFGFHEVVAQTGRFKVYRTVMTRQAKR